MRATPRTKKDLTRIKKTLREVASLLKEVSPELSEVTIFIDKGFTESGSATVELFLSRLDHFDKRLEQIISNLKTKGL